MKHTTTLGMEIDLKPIPLANRSAFIACQRVLTAARDFEMSEGGSDKWHESRYKLHDDFFALCDAVGIPRNSVSEADIAPVLSVLQTGELPEKKPQASTAAS